MQREIQAINTAAAAMIQKNSFDQACRLLLCGTSKLSSCILPPAPIVDATKKLSTSYEGVGQEIEVHAAEDQPQGPQDQHAGNFFSQPFLFEYSEGTICSDFPELSNYQYNTSAAIYLFNLGLCWHTAHYQTRRAKADFLMKAIHCYEEAISLLKTDRGFVPTGPVLKVLLAVCINAAHCNNELANFGQLNRWNNVLQFLLKFSTQEILQSQEVLSMKGFFTGSTQTLAPAA
mmetsp:Transcript_20444/g.26356  ORF Transcript_20444/g.26356 Transcript_20444/m.26356 type:complete len:232 (+) Transcript_20444:105-800(+)|eukprot:CAMPEP_0198153560 /NCGR_PEP_ID=MMETSP1443-20131203/64760_1 /TAXON_ID=186043 /ORGANISM="Entomoneis sp., Strain CCMP2396" /LENGTH=231 /DNA_ID=CAMNT_0043819951 /DNA_START=81 /DNA_END=776 /DNA_ORIENTATION=-